MKDPDSPVFADRRGSAQLPTHRPQRLLRHYRVSETSIRAARCDTKPKGAPCLHYQQLSDRVILQSISNVNIYPCLGKGLTPTMQDVSALIQMFGLVQYLLLQFPFGSACFSPLTTKEESEWQVQVQIWMCILDTLELGKRNPTPKN